MNPADVSYRTSRLIGYLPIAPDNMVRDHRKIAFFDLTELDPAKGEALFGGVGVGEQYATATWEDRAVRLRGPAALTLKDAARRYLKANGFTDANIPPPLQPLPKPADYDERVKALEAQGWTATAMQVHNDRGFAEKDASIASAVLYTLMPPNSLIVVPDSIWTHELWAAYLTGAALRGCHVYVIAPSAPNAPSAGFPQLSRTREIFSRFLEIQKLLGPEIEARGGQAARRALHPARRRQRRPGEARRDAGDLRALPLPQGGLPLPRGVLRPPGEGRGTARGPGLQARGGAAGGRPGPRSPRCTGRRSSSPRGTRSATSCATRGPSR